MDLLQPKPLKSLSPLQIALVGVALVFYTSFAQAEGSRRVSTTLGTSGIGIELSQPLTEQLKVRGVLSAFKLKMTGLETLVGTNESAGGIDYDFTVSGFNLGALLDYHPGAGGFRVSVGLLLTDPKVEFNSVNGQATYNIGNTTYESTDLLIEGESDSNKVAPFLGFGWVSKPTQKGFHFHGDIGVTYMGEPALRLTTSGTAAEVGSSGAAISLQSSADFLADLEVERRELEGEIAKVNFWPMINIGLGYRF